MGHANHIKLICLAITTLFNCGITKDVVIELNREVLRDGFHRDLRTTLTVQQNDLRDLPGSPCSVLLIESLPSGLYVDTFQLGNLAAMGGPQVLTDRPVDIEAPEYLSSQHELYVYSPLPMQETTSDASITMSISIPIHVRYHKPTDDPSITHVGVTMFHPRVLLNCSVQESRMIKAPCNSDNMSVCSWAEVSYKSNSDFLEMQVPVGQGKDVWVVVYFTLIVTVLGCTGLLYVIAYYDKWRVKPKDS